MKLLFQRQFFVLAWIATPMLTFAQPTAFTYQGRLTENGNPANGSYDLQFYLRDAATLGNPVGTTNTVAPVAVSNGLFTVTLDCGAGVFDGNPRWLEIGVRTSGPGAFTTLSPRQQFQSAPYATFAYTASNLVGTLPAAQLAGTVDSAQLADTIEFGAASTDGQLDVYRTTAGTAAISLLGSASQISTYGSDGLEQTRLWGISYGELLLHNNLANNATAVLLTAQGSSGGLLRLSNTNGSNRANLVGANVGGTLTLYQADGDLGLTANGGPASGSLYLRNAAGTITVALDGSGGTVNTTNFYAGTGLATAPGFAFAGDSNTGIFSPAANALAVATAGVERLRVDASGNVGIGISSPQSPLDVRTPVNEPAVVMLTSGGSWPLTLGQTPSSVMVISNGGVGRIFMPAGGNVGIGTENSTHLLHVNGQARSTQSTWATTSDQRVKRNVATLDGSLAKIVSMRPVIFDYTPEYIAGRAGYEGRFTGFIAQEVEKVFPEMVQTVTEEVGDHKVTDFRLLNSGALTPHLVSAIQGLNQKLHEELNRRDAENAELKARLERLEKLLTTLARKN